MQWLRKIRNGVYFVDILLVVGAVIAIIGLATFVHIRGSKVPKTLDKKAPLSNSSQHVAYASPSPTSSSTTSDSSSTKSTPSSDQMSSTSTATQLPLKSVCDETKKLGVMNSYDQTVAKENNHYQTELTQKQGVLGLTGSALKAATDTLLRQHDERLDQINVQLTSNLAAINCNT